MNRRRKLGDNPGLKNTPRKMVAAEECGSVVESGKRRLRSARRSGFSRAGDGPPQPLPRPEKFPVAASCSKSNPEEKYETPKRVLKMDLLSSTFSSPNDPDGQNDIFWDQNSPMTKQLGKGRKTKIYTTDSDEISHIVNRIAPQDEKPTTDSMLGVWIGEAAIPCTPNVAKGKSRAKKVSCTKLKTQNQEEELMKLAKQFDKNMEELDVIQEQNKQNHDFTQMISEAETLNNYKDNVQMQLLHDIIPEIDNAVIKKLMKGNTKVSVGSDQYSSQMPFDQNAEAAFNAIFDGSTQKCSGQLSQDWSDDFWNTITTFEKKSALKEEKIITNKTQVTEKLPNKPATSLSHQADTPERTESYVTSNTKEPKAFNKLMDAFTTGDFEEDWENLLSNEPFVTQNVEMSEPFLVPEIAQIVGQKEICTINSESDRINSRMNVSLDPGFRDSKILLDVSSKTRTSEIIDPGKYRFSPDSNDKPDKLLSIGNKVKFDKSFNKTIQDKTQDCSVAPDPTKVKEDIHTKCISNVNVSQKKSTLNTGYSEEQKNKSIFHQSFKTHSNIVPFDSAALNNANQTNASNFHSLSDDWNDPSFANEIDKAWEADDVEDDLLYQACDDIERLTQQHNMRKDSKTLESILEINNSSKQGAKTMFTTSKQESQLVQSTHLSSVSAQSSSLTESSQKNKSVKMQKGEICGNFPDFSGTTTNVTLYSKNSKCLINNLPVSWNNTDVPVQVSSSRSVLTRSSSVNVNSDQMRTQIASYKKNLNTSPLSHRTITDEAQSDLNSTVRFSKYTFTKIRNSAVLSHINQNYVTGSIGDTKITQSSERNRTVNSLCGKAVQQQSLVKPESLKQPSKEEEEKNRKYSPEEIQKKRQEALVRRMAKAQASTMKAVPT
ncbi:ETAA1 activator of ATR kinase [Phyllostomus discolor]|uniref:ETAA1 activator of ATR kinase n=2 Tax=Phyllostomus discolor TaxID=89673 RepID=A0A834A0A0_9CHIR|nr:ETAA1 activator of ATR kinase [Phyllostomus discolor]